jgi:hypothetical protein
VTIAGFPGAVTYPVLTALYSVGRYPSRYECGLGLFVLTSNADFLLSEG